MPRQIGPHGDPVVVEMNAWIAERLNLDAGQIRAAGSGTFATIPPGGSYTLVDGTTIEASDGQVLVVWTGIDSIPLAEYLAHKADLRLKHEGGRHRADR